MIKVTNRKIIGKLAKRSFKASKSRNRIAIIAIALTTVLFTSLFTVGMGIVDTFQKQTLRQSGGDGHAVLKYINDEQYNKMKNHSLIKTISYNKIISESVDNPEFLKRRAEMYYMDDNAIKLGFCEPTVGNAPKAENEIITDTVVLDLLGVERKIGATVPITYTAKGKQVRQDFVLSGFWESDTAFNVGMIIVSEEFTKAHASMLQYTYNKDNNMTGAINSYIMFENTFNLEQKMHRVIEESGYTVEDSSLETPSLPTDIACNTNWAYLGSLTIDSGTMVGLVLAAILIVYTGYLIIYNIFQISVLRDIRFYGLLKTIGTTSKQIKKIIRRQALLLSIVGIPIGLILGYGIGNAILPLLIEQSSYSASATVYSMNPLIFIGASLFSLLTVFISVRKPGKLASKVSPIEAVRYNGGNEKIKAKQKRSTNGGKLPKMALSNLTRNRKSTCVTIISLSLSLILLNSVFTISNGFDMDKYLSKFVDTDYLIANAQYYNNNFRFPEDALSDSFIEAVKSQDGFTEGGKLFKDITGGKCTIIRENPDELNKYHVNKAQDGMPMLDLYGLDDLPLSRLDIAEGELDVEKLKTGKYIIEGLGTDDDNSIYPETSHYNIGDKVKIKVGGKVHEYTLLAKAKINTYTNSDRTASNYTMYLPSQEYQNIVPEPIAMSYAFNVDDSKEASMEQFLEKYTQKTEPLMNFESKIKYVEQFKSLQAMLITVGGILSVVVGLIGILNFINSMLTSIFTRRKEFAILQGIGMTQKQLANMLIFEGLYYAIATIFVSFVFGILFSVTVIGGVVSNLWFFSYQFVILPLVVVCTILILLSIIIPSVAYYSVNKQSIVERLREAE